MFVQLVGFISPRMYVRQSVERIRNCSLNVRNRLVWFVPTFPMYNFLAELQIVAETGTFEDGLNIFTKYIIIVS